MTTAFQEAIKYQESSLGGEIEKKIGGNNISNRFSLPQCYRGLFEEVSKLMQKKIELVFDGYKLSQFLLLKKETEFKAYLDGLLTGLSDLEEDKIISVLTEFQIGEGKRIDIAMQVVDYKDEKDKLDKLTKSTFLGIELKSPPSLGEEEKKKIDNQLEGYAKGKNIKSITEGKNAAFIM